MKFRYLFCNFTKNQRRLTSTFEVLKEIVTSKEPTLSEIDQLSLNGDLKNKRSIHKKISRINDFFSSKQSLNGLKNVIPASYFLLKNKSGVRPMFLVDKEVACNIWNVLHPHLKIYDGHVMEVNAGVGVLTEELLKAEIQNLRIYEPDPILCNHLLKLIKLHESKARLFNANLLSLPKMQLKDREDDRGRLEAIFDGLPSCNWEDEPAVKLIAALRDNRFILHIMFSIILQTGLCDYGRPELFLIVPPAQYEVLKSNPSEGRSYKSNSILFQIMCDHEELLRVPERVFIPWDRKSNAKAKKRQPEESCEELCLVRIIPKRNLLQSIPPELLKPFWFFVKYLMHRKSFLLIDQMEKWIPGSGVRLISGGYTIYNDCGSLTPDDYLKIFMEFTSWPEFHSCSFLPFVENTLSKIFQYRDGEDIVLDAKFKKLLSKESDVSDTVEVFDDRANFQENHKNGSVGKKVK